MLNNGASIRYYEAHRHMNFSLIINECGICENNIRGHSFFWIGSYEFTNNTILAKKSKQTSVRERDYNVH